MRKSLTISIPKPCHENWDAMTPEDKGRHCQVCEKTVYDFTQKTDEQIIKTFEKDNNLCGRFKSQQLDREIVLSRKSKNNFASIAASGLFAFLALGTQEANAQGAPQIIQTEPVKHDSIKGKVAQSILKEKVITGTIIDQDGLPLPGVNIIIKGTTRGAQSDFDGNYTIKVKIGDTLIYSYVGLQTTEVVFKNQSKHDIVLLEDKNFATTGIVVVAGMPSYYLSDAERKQRKEARQEKRQERKEQRQLKKEND